MQTLILIKHSLPEITPDVDAEQWRLSAEGRWHCGALAEALAPYALHSLIASEEPKASETAQLVAAQLHIPWRTAPNLHEHDRRGAGYLGEAAFQATMRQFFAQPDELIFGRETGRQAQGRFTRAVEDVLHTEGQSNDCVALLAHGTVITLFVATALNLDADASYTFWRGMALPSFVALTLDDEDGHYRIAQGWHCHSRQV
ncbi:MAG: histidine phosphatase family protein [Ktedonobacterales bacterium]